jgi:general secretion pathway protein L
MEYLILQITEKRLDVARFAISGKVITVSGSGVFELGGGQTLEEVIRKIATESNGLARVILCLPPALFAQRSVELPLKDLRKVREIIPAHLQGELALPPEEVIFDVQPSGEGKFIAYWVKRSDVEHALSVFRDAGLEPAMITSAPFAWSFLPGVPSDCAVSDGTAVALISGGNLSFIRSLVALNRNREIVSTIAALEFTETGLPEQLVLFGQESGSLSSDVQVATPVTILEETPELAETFTGKGDFGRLVGLYAVARACHSNALPDFRRGDLAWTAGDAKLRRKYILTAILAAVTIVLLFGVKLLQYRQATTDLVSLNSSITKIYREIFPGRTKAVDELAEIKGEIRKLTGADSSGSIIDVLKKVADAKGNTINGVYELEVEGRNLTIKGDARSSQAVNEFKNALQPLAAAIELGEVKSRPDGTVTFTMTAAIKEAGK